LVLLRFLGSPTVESSSTKCVAREVVAALPARGHLRRLGDAADLKTSRLDQGEKMGEPGSQMGQNAHKFGLVESRPLRQEPRFLLSNHVDVVGPYRLLPDRVGYCNNLI
jgi:hypothetical protein